MKFPIEKQFRLTENFIEKYKEVHPNFGFNGLGKFVFYRTYSRIKEDGSNEEWWETVRRVVEGIYSIQMQHIDDYNLGWNQMKSQKSAQEMYDRIFTFKMLGSGRSLWAMGTKIVMEKGLTEALFNCSFLSTDDMSNPGDVFANIMDFLMLGVGVGTDTRGAGKVIVKQIRDKEHVFVIPDSREGWVESVKLLVNSFFGGMNYSFDYSEIRKSGEPIKTFGGTASGFAPLKELHDKVSNVLSKNVGVELTQTAIADISNLIGVCVVSGNVRRSAEVLLGKADDEFLNLKNYEKNPERVKHGWASNNTVLADVGMDYSGLAPRIADNGEPGLMWLNNFRDYGRMDGKEKNRKDTRILGGNPCLEIGLESGELCNLVEVIPSNHSDIDDFTKTIKYAYLFAKSITLLNTNWANTNKVLLRNRRIGIGLTGISQFISENNLFEMRRWMESGYDVAKHYDDVYSDWFAIPKSIKMTTIKPSGTLSLLAGVTPGLHYPQSNFYIRRIRLSKTSPFVKVLKKARYTVTPASEDPQKTVVVEFPVKLRNKMRTLDDVSIWEQIKLAEFCQKHWSDNGVSVTVTFKESEKKDLLPAIEYAQFGLKGVSFLPTVEDGVYKQMPYETIDEKTYLKMYKKTKPLSFKNIDGIEAIGEKYCETNICEMKTESDNISLKIEELNLG